VKERVIILLSVFEFKCRYLGRIGYLRRKFLYTVLDERYSEFSYEI